MGCSDLVTDIQGLSQKILGYVNFSSGASDPRFLKNLNELFALLDTHPPQTLAADKPEDGQEPTWRALGRVLQTELDRLHGSSEAFRQVDQAKPVLRMVFDELPVAYRRGHGDLLFHQTDEALFRPFFIGRMFEVVLSGGGPWDNTEQLVRSALERLNNFIGHRPVAVLETEQKIQPYAQEWVRPIPLYIAGAGVAVGRYHDLVEKMLEILGQTDPHLLDQAWFDPQALDELAFDPRAYDFDHPVNRRPNYHFGQWDPHHIDNRGYYRRFVVQQVTLDAMLDRVRRRGDLPCEEVLFEAAAVLTGTILMGSGVSGSRPDSHDSSTTLATLLPHVAAYRDVFYEQLMARLPAAHGKRLRDEAAELRQPLGGARQHLNQELARRRADQLQHVHLAQLFARMGYTEAAACQVRVVPVASARIKCQINCRLATAHLQIDRGQLEQAAELIPQIVELLHRGIHCGALVDPWNILGFGGQFSLFPALENSIPDHRVDELIELMNEIFGLYARLERAAAAAGQSRLQEKLSEDLRSLGQWWDKFASIEVSSLDGISGRQTWESAAHVATALGQWHEAGTAAGDVAFWRAQAERFHSPKAYAQVVEALLEQGDPVASMALLMSWLSQAEQIPLAEGKYSFHALATRWMKDLWGIDGSSEASTAQGSVPPAERWALAQKFLDYVEANADEYWRVPRLEWIGQSSEADDPQEEEDGESEGLFSAAYENVTYRDSAADGFEGETLEGGQSETDEQLVLEAERIVKRLDFLTTVARLWKLAVAASLGSTPAEDADRREVPDGWLSQAAANRNGLSKLLAQVHRYRIPLPGGGHESLVDYDRRRAIKEALLERIISTCVETADAHTAILATMADRPAAAKPDDWEAPAQRVLHAAFRGDVQSVLGAWPELLDALLRQPLLYISLSKGGNPQRIVASRSLQQVLRGLLRTLPRLGLLSQTYRLIETIQDMERNHPAGPGAITEFDRLFEIGYRGIVESLVVSSRSWVARPRKGRSADEPAELDLIDCLERATERLLRRWLGHSRNIRLSTLETVVDRRRWRQLKQFIQRYGHDLFTQRFMNLGNLRAILHQGAEEYLRSLQESPEKEVGAKLLLDLEEGSLSGEQAARWLTTALEAVVENYPEYMDYNSTTTQSDRGEMLYTLLDFLRLQANYDRVAWNLRPVVLAHEVLVRCGRAEAAEMWREAVAQRTAEVADEHLRRFRRLSQRYGMRLPSIADSLGERFVRPLAIDRLRALVRPAMDELHGGRNPVSFGRLEEEISQFTEEPTGVGFDVPAWLEALEQEVEDIQSETPEDDEPLDPHPDVPHVLLSLQQAREQIEDWEEEGIDEC